MKILRGILNSLKKAIYRYRTIKVSIRYSFNKKIRVGKNVYISKHTKLNSLYGGKIQIGDNSEIHEYVLIYTYGGDIEIGNNCSINPFCVIYGHGGLKIGNGVRIATHSVIIPANHTFTDKDKPIYLQPETRKGIFIDDDVWIGSGVRVLDGVKIGKGAIVASGAVVNSDIAPFTVVGGVPAKFIKNRGE